MQQPYRCNHKLSGTPSDSEGVLLYRKTKDLDQCSSTGPYGEVRDIIEDSFPVPKFHRFQLKRIKAGSNRNRVIPRPKAVGISRYSVPDENASKAMGCTGRLPQRGKAPPRNDNMCEDRLTLSLTLCSARLWRAAVQGHDTIKKNPKIIPKISINV